MSNTTLTEKIIASAKERAAEIAATATTEVAAIERETKSTVSALQADSQAKLAKEEEHRSRVALSRARQVGRIAVQSTKRNHIDGVFADVVRSVVESPSAEYIAFFTMHVQATLPTQFEGVSVSAPANRLDETKQILSNVGCSAEVKVGAFSAGLLVETTDGVYDVTLERLISERRAELEVKIIAATTV